MADGKEAPNNYSVILLKVTSPKREQKYGYVCLLPGHGQLDLFAMARQQEGDEEVDVAEQGEEGRPGGSNDGSVSVLLMGVRGSILLSTMSSPRKVSDFRQFVMKARKSGTELDKRLRVMLRPKVRLGPRLRPRRRAKDKSAKSNLKKLRSVLLYFQTLRSLSRTWSAWK
eukprot:8290755-Heterocapsa_arctica.AAC.1